MARLGEGHFVTWRDWWLRLEKGIFGGGIGGFVGRRTFWWRDGGCWEKGHFCYGIGGYVGRRSFLGRNWWLRRGEGHFCGGIGGYVGEKGIFVAGLVATSGRRAFSWRDW
jgi:hypothetical protein